ncbi:MAG TPA: hypothetical protein ENJ60_12490 [Aeromonadales bacterium]|nr:hypothetical protein [Aeromonadales bacterium]
MKKSMICIAVASILSVPVYATDEAQDTSNQVSNIAQAFSEGDAHVALRYRYENVDQANFADTADLSAVRFRLNFQTKSVSDFSAFFEADHLAQVWDTDYNSKLNGNTAFPVIADPMYTEMNQAYISYTGIKNTTVKYGRQRINLDNQRFVGGVGWRQNEQTYDGVTIVNTGIKDTTVVFASLYNVNNILGGNLSKGQHNILNVTYKGLGIGAITGYGYLLENISDTYGIRLKGSQKVSKMDLGYELEYATQETDNTASISTDYYLLEASLGNKSFTGKVGYEVHTAKNGVSFQTPLGTNHKFNGWADKFLAIQGDGMEDTYFGAIIPFSGMKLSAFYHDFAAENSSRNFGTEFDIALSKKFNKTYGLLLKYASYSAKDFSSDTDKLWIQFTANF